MIQSYTKFNVETPPCVRRSMLSEDNYCIYEACELVLFVKITFKMKKEALK